MEEDQSSRIKEFLRSKNFLKSLMGIALGGLAGFLFFWFVGCNTGTCPITSNPYSTIFIGSLMGLVIVS